MEEYNHNEKQLQCTCGYTIYGKEEGKLLKPMDISNLLLSFVSNEKKASYTVTESTMKQKQTRYEQSKIYVDYYRGKLKSLYDFFSRRKDCEFVSSSLLFIHESKYNPSSDFSLIKIDLKMIDFTHSRIGPLEESRSTSKDSKESACDANKTTEKQNDNISFTNKSSGGSKEDIPLPSFVSPRFFEDEGYLHGLKSLLSMFGIIHERLQSIK